MVMTRGAGGGLAGAATFGAASFVHPAKSNATHITAVRMRGVVQRVSKSH